MTTRIKLRRDTAANWAEYNPILAAGEPGLETDTGKTKYGDGTTHWVDLKYANGGINPRQIVGSFTGYGPEIPNNSNYDIWFDTVVADADGNAYYVGGQNDSSWMVAVKVDSQGEVVWEKEVTWADGYEGSGVSAVFNTATNELLVTGTFYRNWQDGLSDDSAVIITLDAADGTIVGDPTVVRDDVTEDGSRASWVNPVDIIITADGEPVICGDMGGAPQSFNVTTATGSTLNELVVDSAQFLDKYPRPYSNWYITGTNIGYEISITGVNYYYNQPATNIAGGTGTNALFDITADGAGGYTVVLGTDQGSGYRYLNQILVLGSVLGGADGTNDATITVQGTDAGVITSVTITGMSTGSGTYTGVSGTNIPSGTGATFTANWRVKGSEVWFPDYQAPYYGVTPQQSGSGYAVGDTIALAPECYGGTTTGTITVTNMNGAGAITDWAFTGTFDTSKVKLTTDGGYGIDYAVADGVYQVNNYNSDAFVWAPTWAKSFGDGESDQANAMARDSMGNIYVAGETYDYSVQGGRSRGFLVKLSSNGSLVWSKNFDPAGFGNFDNGYTGVAVDGDDNVIVVQAEQITKVDSNGTVLWQQIVEQYSPFDMWNACVDVDSDNNIYVAAEYDYMGQVGGDNFLIIKLDTDGNVLWQRDAGTAADEDTRWNDGYQILTVKGNRYYVCGSSYNGGDDIGFAMDMPTDGSGVGNAGRYFYSTTTWALTTTTGVVDTMEIAFTSTEFTVYTTNTFAVNTLTNVSETVSIRTGDVDGRIDNLYSISFEDGSVQTTAYVGGLSQASDSPHIYNTNNLYLTLHDAGKMHRWYANGWNDTVWIYVPSNADVPFPVGTQMHFMKDQGIQTLFFDIVNGNSDVTIMPAQPANYMTGSIYNSGEGWSVHDPDWNEYPCICTLTKVDTDRWLLSCNSPVQVMDWSW